MFSSRSGRPGPRGTEILAFLLVIMAMPTARAAGKDAKERTAKTACLSGDYAKGVALLAELYVSTGHTIYLFNQGRCYMQNGKYEEAIVRFREFQLKNTEAGNAPDTVAEKHIASCQALIDKQKPVTSGGVAPSTLPTPAVTPTVPDGPPSVPAEPNPLALEPQSEVVALPQPAEPPHRGRGLRIAGIATTIAGLGGIATGVALNLKANSLAKELESANDSRTTLYSRSKASTRSSYQTWGWVAYGAGAACLAGGAILYFLGYHNGHTETAFVPTVADGHVGALLQGSF